MTEIEVIYLSPKESKVVYLERDKETESDFLENKEEDQILKPNIKISEKKSKEKVEQATLPGKKTIVKKSRNLRKMFTIMIGAFLLFTSIGFVALDNGYLPIKAFIPVTNHDQPVGCTGEIKIESYSDEYSSIEDAPSLNNINYKVFLSDANVDNIISNYKYKLEKEGYNLRYQGEITKKGITFHYYGFVKNLVGVGIIISDDVDKISGQGSSVVLFTRGGLHEYRNVVSWGKTKLEL